MSAQHKKRTAPKPAGCGFSDTWANGRRVGNMLTSSAWEKFIWSVRQANEQMKREGSRVGSGGVVPADARKRRLHTVLKALLVLLWRTIGAAFLPIFLVLLHAVVQLCAYAAMGYFIYFLLVTW